MKTEEYIAKLEEAVKLFASRDSWRRGEYFDQILRHSLIYRFPFQGIITIKRRTRWYSRLQFDQTEGNILPWEVYQELLDERDKDMSKEIKYCIDCVYYNVKKELSTGGFKHHMCLNTFNIVTKDTGDISCAVERDAGTCGKEGKNFKGKK